MGKIGCCRLMRGPVVLAAGTAAPPSDTCHGFGQLFNPIIPIIQIIESAPGAGSRAPSCLERAARRARWVRMQLWIFDEHTGPY